MKLLLYCTKAKPYLQVHPFDLTNSTFRLSDDSFKNLNGKIVAECDFEVDTIAMQKGAEDRIYGNNGFMGYGVIKKNGSFNWYDENKACLSEKELFKYLEGFEKPYLIPTNYKCKIGYALHIKNMHIFDKPKELSNYKGDSKSNFFKIIEKAPQNMQMVLNEKLEDCILISIQPQWLCKILNGEKTIEVRKKVLKEMLK